TPRFAANFSTMSTTVATTGMTAASASASASASNSPPITPRTRRLQSSTKEGPPCPECQCPNSIKKGKRRNRMRWLQVYQCCECLHRFTAGDAGKNKTYPLRAILETVSTFNKGHSLSENSRAHCPSPSYTYTRTDD